MKTYLAAIAEVDRQVGRLREALAELKLGENTILVFSSDNGPEDYHIGNASNAGLGSPGSLRGRKRSLYEGGIRVPFVMQWKGILPVGQTYREMIAGFDCHATALGAAGIEASQNKPLDGVNLLPYLTGKITGRPHEQLFWRAGEKHAARIGDWKLVSEPAHGGTMLFNLKDDIGEQHDLAQSQPEKLKEVQAAFAQWASQMKPAQWIRQDSTNAEAGGRTKPIGKSKRGKGKGQE